MSNKDGKNKKNNNNISLKGSYNPNFDDYNPIKLVKGISDLSNKTSKKWKQKSIYNSQRSNLNNNKDNNSNSSIYSTKKKTIENPRSKEKLLKSNKNKSKSKFVSNNKNDYDYLNNNYLKKKEEDDRVKKEKEKDKKKKKLEEVQRQIEFLEKEREKEKIKQKEKDEEKKREEERIKKKEKEKEEREKEREEKESEREKRKKEEREEREKREREKEREKKEKEREREKEEKEREREKEEKNLYSNSSLDPDVYKIITSKIGLKNLGNTCYMNTCLQNLIHSEYFIKNLFEHKSLISFDSYSTTPISKEFFKICEKFISSDISSYGPSFFKSEFGDKHRNFSGYGQQDTQEFCRILLEDMNKELNTVKQKIPYKELDTKNKSKIQCDKEFDDFFRHRENSFIIDVFYGQIINIFQCKHRDKSNYNAYCNQETYSFEKIMDLPLLLPKKDGSIDIYDLLDDYFEKMDIDFETKCEKCGKKSTHEKQMKFSQPPNILILSLQRISKRGKNEVEVNFPDELNLNKYIDNDIYKGNTKYTLYGIGNHSGSINFGHYYAYIKLNDNYWYEYNDSSVSSHSYGISKRSAYILFYKKNK